MFFRVYNVPVYVLGKEYVHFKDVACLLAKIAIENKYGLKDPIKIESRRIQTRLEDIWHAKYPSRPASPRLREDIREV